MSPRQSASRVKLNPQVVRRRLIRLNLSQNELARRVGITSGYLSQMMKGTRCPSAEVLVRLMDVLGVTAFEELFILEVASAMERDAVRSEAGGLGLQVDD